MWCEQLLQDMFYAGIIYAIPSTLAKRTEKTIVPDAHHMEMLDPDVCTMLSLRRHKLYGDTVFNALGKFSFVWYSL